MIAVPSPQRYSAAIERLGLERAGDLITTHCSLVGPVLRDGEAAYLKVAVDPEVLVGFDALEQWGGHGAIRLLARDDDAYLLERAGATLRATITDDAEATRLLCQAIARIHAAPHTDLSRFPTLRRWFRSLWEWSDRRFAPARRYAEDLVDTETPVLLHGDVHHENLLVGGDRGWLLIDPAGIAGPATFDYANLFTNWTLDEAVQHFDRRLEIVTAEAGIEPELMLRWLVAWSALSGIWHLEDGDPASAVFPHTIMDLALDRLRV